MVNKVRWVQYNNIYTLRDNDNNILITIEDRTCNRNIVKKEMLDNYASEFVGINKKEDILYENGIASK